MSELNDKTIERIIEAALFAANKTLNLDAMQNLFEEGQAPDKDHIKDVLVNIKKAYEERGIELVEVSTGFRFQVRSGLSPWVGRLWEERATRYSRALLETLAIIAYRQPITRGEIEDIRGVVVSSNIVKTLLDHEFARVVGHREVPGRPALYATTKEFLDHFNLKSIEELPALADLTDLDLMAERLDTPINEATMEAIIDSGMEDTFAVSDESEMDAEDALEREDAVETRMECLIEETQEEIKITENIESIQG